MMNARLQHVSIPRPPGSDAIVRAFFGDLLGLEEIPAPASIQHMDVIWFKAGQELELHLFREDPIDDPSIRHFCLVVDDLAETRGKLSQAGYAPYDVERIPGRPRFFCRDPFGNIIEFTTIEADYLQAQANLD